MKMTFRIIMLALKSEYNIISVIQYRIQMGIMLSNILLNKTIEIMIFFHSIRIDKRRLYLRSINSTFIIFFNSLKSSF